MKKENDLEKILENLTERVNLLLGFYNPDELNLHFENIEYADAALFEALLSIGQDAWKVIQVNQTRETSYWFYDFFQLVARGSVRVLIDDFQKYISEDVIVRLALLLCEISQMTSKDEFGGDITSRNYEALANLLLAFRDIRKTVMIRAKQLNNQQVINYAKRMIKMVREDEKKNATEATQSNESSET